MDTLRAHPVITDALEHAPCGFLRFGEDDVIVQTNATLREMLGYEAGAMDGMKFSALLGSGARFFSQTHFFPLLRLRGKAEEIYLSLLSKNGTPIPLLVNAVRHPREGGAMTDCIFVRMQQRSHYEDALLVANKEADRAAERLRVSEASLRMSEDRLNRLHHVMSDPQLGETERLQRLLRLGIEEFGLENGFLGEIAGGLYRVALVDTPDGSVPVGFSCDVGDAFCSEVVLRNDLLAIESASQSHWRTHRACTAFGTEVYFGVPLPVAGEIFGTLCFTSRVARLHEFSTGDHEFLRLLALTMGTEMTRQQIAGKLSAAEERQRFAMQAANAGAWDWDIGAGNIIWSPENYVLYDFDPAQGSPSYADWESRVHPGDLARTHVMARDVVEGKAPAFRAEFRVVHRDGRILWLLALGRVQRDATGTALRLSGINLDITEHKRAEHALRESESKYRTLFNSIDEGFCIIEKVHGEASEPLDFRYLEANAAFETQSGVGKVVGKTIRQMFPDVTEDWYDTYEAILTTGESIRFERGLGIGGRILELYAFRVEDETHRRVAVIFKDITERRHAESELIAAKSTAEKANRAKTDFLSGMSHELRTPLNGILGFAQLLESGSSPPTPSQKRSIDQILKAGWYLLDLINEILDLALIESGKVMLSQDPVSLAEVVLECRAMIEPQAQHRGIGIQFPRFEIPCFVKADRTRLKQVLINLVYNAIKYNKPEGTVVVDVTLKPPELIRICVRDTGAGLAPAQLAQLFQPFNRLGKEAGAEEGTGIGLVVTKRLVELMGGTIGVDSTLGVGSVFWVELSLTAAPQLAAADAELTAPVRAQLADGVPQRMLLYVEDNPANLELMEALVARRPDLRLLSAANGDLGIEFARAYQPEVILMDINLPGISGIEVMKILRKDPSTAHIPVIALSANAMPRDIEKGLEAGFFNYITKPIRVNQFMDAMDQALTFAQTTSRRAAKVE